MLAVSDMSCGQARVISCDLVGGDSVCRAFNPLRLSCVRREVLLNSLQNKYNRVSSVHCRFVGKGYRIANPPIRPINSVCAALFWSRNSSTACASVRRLSLTSVRILCRRVSFNSDERLVKKIL
jgi:hypothetical protein